MQPQSIPGNTWENQPEKTNIRMVNLEAITQRVALMRSEWEEATEGAMERVTVNLRAIFEDIENIIKQ